MSLISQPYVNSVVLRAGEQFTLPPGAKLIATSNLSSLDSTCDIPELEEFECYVGMIAAAGEEGNVSQYFESGDVSVIGYRLNGKDYNFTSAFPADDNGFYAYNEILSTLKASLRGMIIDGSVGIDSNDERGALTYFVVKTIPSIGDNLEFLLSTGIPHDDYNQNIVLRSPFYKYSDLTGKGYKGLPDCINL